jgi:hypothetical protein
VAGRTEVYIVTAKGRRAHAGRYGSHAILHLRDYRLLWLRTMDESGEGVNSTDVGLEFQWLSLRTLVLSSWMTSNSEVTAARRRDRK